MYTPVIFVVIVLFMRYFLEGTIDLVEDIVALTLDAIDLVAYHLKTGYLQFPGLSIVTLINLQLLPLGGFVAFLVYLTASHPRLALPTRQSLQDLLDQAVRKVQETEDRLLNAQCFTENLQARYDELESQNKRLQVENEQANAEKDSIRKDTAEHAKEIENLKTDLAVAESLNRRLERKRFIVQFSLQVAERNADRLKQAHNAAEDKASKLTEELEKAKKRAVTVRRVTKQLREDPDHTDCLKNAASQADRVDALQKALKTLQSDQDNNLRRQASETSALREALVEKEENHQALKKQVESLMNDTEDRQLEISQLEESLTAKEACLQQAQADILDFEDRQVKINQLEESLTVKEACLQQAQADILDLTEQVEGLNAAKDAAADLESVKLKRERNKIDQLHGEVVVLKESLIAKDACLQQAQADILDLTEQVEELNAAKGATGDLESVKMKSQRDEIDRLHGEVVALKAAYDSREAELMDASAAAMSVDNPADEIQPKEIANLQDNIKELQAALDQAHVNLSAARPVSDEMDLVSHECDHTRCQQRERQQDSNLAKVQAISSAQEKKISELERQVREQRFWTQGNPATIPASPASPASPGVMSQEAAKLRKAKADSLGRAGRDAEKKIKELEDSLRAKDMELNELTARIQREIQAATMRVENTIREKLAGARKVLEEMKTERDRCRANNSTLLQRIQEAGTALAECQRQRDQSVAEAGRLMGELRVVQGGAGASNTKKREIEKEEGDSRPPKINRPDV